MSIQIVFTIELETESLGASAITSLDADAGTGALAAAFTEQASSRNEIVSVSTSVLENICTTCGAVIAVFEDDKVSAVTYVSTLLVACLSLACLSHHACLGTLSLALYKRQSQCVWLGYGFVLDVPCPETQVR